jgi:cytochrome P450
MRAFIGTKPTFRFLRTWLSFSSETMRLIFILPSLLLVIVRAFDRWLASRSYRSFAQSHGCRLPPAQTTSVLHKLHLLSEKYTNIFEDYYAAKFTKFGNTHAIIDRFSRPAVIHTIDPLNLRTVLVTARKDWLVFKGRRNALKPLAQDSVLLTDGMVWHQKRAFLNGRVNGPRAKVTAYFEADVDLFFRAIECCRAGQEAVPVNLSTLVQRMTLDMSSRYLFGISTECQLTAINHARDGSASHSEWQKVTESYVANWNILRDYISRRAAAGSKYWLVDGVEYRRACSQFRSFADLFVQKAKQAAADTVPKPPGQTQSLISDLISSLEDANKARDIVQELLIAGQNMTGCALEWALAQLAANPDIYVRLRDEILAACGDGRDSGSLQSITWDVLQSCNTLQHVIRETLRCHPIVATMSRTAARDTVLPRGGGVDGDEPIAVPKGGTVASNIYLLHRRKEYWGNDADEWRPDRWIGRKLGPEYVPFGAGARLCLGRYASCARPR